MGSGSMKRRGIQEIEQHFQVNDKQTASLGLYSIIDESRGVSDLIDYNKNKLSCYLVLLIHL